MSELLGGRDLEATLASIERAQTCDGCIAWWPGSHADPWNHVEAAMALDVGGRADAAEAAFEWLRSNQAPDGAWGCCYRDGRIEDAAVDANFTAYIAAGVWHHFLVTGDASFLERNWPMVERAIEFVLDLQLRDGAISWARDRSGRPWPGALLTSSSCILLSLRCAISAAAALGCERPDWELSLENLRTAVAGAGTFEDKRRYSMDWYYPIIGGARRGSTAHDLLHERWDEFVIEGRGVRCVSDRPWVTTGETCELVLALAACGRTSEGREVLSWVGRLRAGDGSYWTGATHPDGTIWPREAPSWCAAAVLLATSSLDGSSAMAAILDECGSLVGGSELAPADPLEDAERADPGPLLEGLGL